MDILITGAGGFIGGNIAERLAPRHSLTLLFRRPPSRAVPGCRIVAADLAEGLLDHPELSGRRFDAILHAAAQSPGPGVSADDFVRSNVLGTRSVAEFAHRNGVGKVVYLSSLSVCGTVLDPVLDEETPVLNPDVYGLTKRLGELILQELDGTATLSLRLPGVVGRGAKNGWMCRTARALLRNETVSIYNPDGAFNNVIHTDSLSDFVEGALAQGWTGHELLVLGASDPLTVRGTVQLLKDLLRSDSEIVVEGGGKTPFTLSARRACERFAYRPLSTQKNVELFTAQRSFFCSP